MEQFDEEKELQRIEKAIAERQQNAVAPQSSPTNKIVEALLDNGVAVDMVREQYTDIKNQKQIAKKMGDVVNKKTDADIETADLQVEQQRLANRVEKARQNNELLKCHLERKLLRKENRHKLTMQKFRHRKEKYGDLLLRHCRRKTKGEDGKWEYQFDKEGNPVVNMPNRFVLLNLILLDSIVMFLNQIADVIGSTNKVVRKAIWIILFVVCVLVAPVRNAILNLFGINIG